MGLYVTSVLPDEVGKYVTAIPYLSIICRSLSRPLHYVFDGTLGIPLLKVMTGATFLSCTF